MTTTQLAPTALIEIEDVILFSTSFLDFNELYRQHNDGIKAYIERIFHTLSPDDLDDMLQTTFTTAMERRVYPYEKELSWLQAIAKTAAVKIINQNKRQAEIITVLSNAQPVNHPEVLGRRAGRGLTSLQQQVIHMHNQGWNYRQIAQDTGKSIQAIRSLAYRARQQALNLEDESAA